MSEHEHCEAHDCHGCSGDCDCHGGEESRLSKILLAVSAALALISIIPINGIFQTVAAVAAVVLSAYPILFDVVKNIRHFSLSEKELMLIAVIAACCLGELREAAAVAILYRFGELLEDRAVEHSRKSIDSLSKIQQDFAHLVCDDGTTEKVHAESVKIGSLIKVLPYERFPIDGVVVGGSSTADASAITGESLPVELSEGSAVKSGMVNGRDSLTVKTTEAFANSTASRIVQMVEQASEKKGKTQKIITRIAKVYTPVVVGLAAVIAVVPSIVTKNPTEWIHRALVFLVASCPCALVISVPLGFYSGLGAAAKKGIIVKGTVFAEAIAKAKAAVFDKTGTLTTGSFEVVSVSCADGFTQTQVLTLAAAAEYYSEHPIARSIVMSAPKIDESLLSDFSETAGSGAAVTMGGKRIFCGSPKSVKCAQSVPRDEICVCVDGELAGTISVRSSVREGAADMIDALKSQGIEHAFMLTGDNEIAAKSVAEECEIDEYFCNLMPEDKLARLEEIKKKYGKVIYVGDGINDAPVLAAADAGIAMGLGTQAASEAADVILTNDSLERLAQAHKLFKRTCAAVYFNILFSIAVKLAVLILGALGLAPVWLAVFADVGVCLICVTISSMIGKELPFRK